MLCLTCIDKHLELALAALAAMKMRSFTAVLDSVVSVLEQATKWNRRTQKKCPTVLFIQQALIGHPRYAAMCQMLTQGGRWHSSLTPLWRTNSTLA